jgi:hypothetical protein
MKKETSLSRTPYDNYRIFHPDGNLMCFCSKRKANWYVKNGLATQSGTDIHLTFKPKGHGEPVEVLTGRLNCCVVTGDETNLTKHHVIPTQFRRYFPQGYKDKNSGDLMVMTRSAHDEYEIFANEFKTKLFNDYITEEDKDAIKAWTELRSLVNCKKGEHFSRLPAPRQVYIELRIAGLSRIWNFTEDELRHRSVNDVRNFSKKIVEKIGVINLIVLWKLHFIKYGRPRHLPEWWKPNLVKFIRNGSNSYKTELIEIDLKEPQLRKLINKYGLQV